MGLLLFFFGGVAKDVLAATVFLRRRQNQKADETVRRWKWRRKIPFVNWYLKRKAGKPANFMERKRNSAIVGAVRGLVNTETFEHIVGVVLNKRSKLKLKMPNAFKKGGSSIPRRNWGKVTIVS
jgi:hypothetical protein